MSRRVIDGQGRTEPSGLKQRHPPLAAMARPVGAVLALCTGPAIGFGVHLAECGG